MSNYTFSVKTDWITVSGKYPPSVQKNPPTESQTAYVNAVSILINVFNIRDFKIAPAGNGRFYRWIFNDNERGIRVHISDRSNQGWLVEFTGRAFNLVDRLDEYIIESVRNNDIRITRYDVAVDVFHSDITVAEIHADVRPTVDRPTKYRVDLIQSKTGESMAVGSRDSQFYLRIYDKAAEQLADFNWLRVELEIKHDAAHALAGDVATLHRRAAAKMLEMLENHFSDVTNAVSAVAGGLKPLGGHVRSDVTDTERWFLTTVLPAFKKLALNDTAAYRRVLAAFEDSAVNIGGKED